MVSSVSFTGTYKVNSQNFDKFSKFQNYALNKELEDGIKTNLKDKFEKKIGSEGFDYKAEQTLIVPDDMDYDVESFCAVNGISYQKYNTSDLLNTESIISRISNAPQGYKKVNVNVEKLEELAKNQDNNFSHCKYDYNKFYSDTIDTMLRSGDEIPASTLIIHNPSNNEDLKKYVDNFGAENLNDGQIMTYFTQSTDDPDHCIYFALKDKGINEIPVYVDKQSYEAGNILGLFE